MARRSVFALSLLVAMAEASFGLGAGVTLDYVQNPDPAAGLRSYTVRATGTGINVLGRFRITGNVYQVFTPLGQPSEWIGNPNGHTLGDPRDSYVLFGDERVPDMPVYSPGSPLNPSATSEAILGGGVQGLGTLSNWVSGLSGSGSTEAAEPMENMSYFIPGDTNADGLVNAKDLKTLAQHWGYSTQGGSTQGDFDGDMLVGAADASILGANWTTAGGVSGEGLGDGSDPVAGGESLASLLSGDHFDAYLLLGSPSTTETTVDLLRLAIPDGAAVAVELEVYTCEYSPEMESYFIVRNFQFFGTQALVLPVPEPAGFVLIAAGLACLFGRRGRPR